MINDRSFIEAAYAETIGASECWRSLPEATDTEAFEEVVTSGRVVEAGDVFTEVSRGYRMGKVSTVELFDNSTKGRTNELLPLSLKVIARPGQVIPVWSKYSNLLKLQVMALPARNGLWKTLRANSGPCNVMLRPFRISFLGRHVSPQP